MSVDLGRKDREFNVLFEKNQKAILAFFIGHGLVREDAKDLVQETFSKTWLHMGDLTCHPEERQRRWIFRVAANLLADFFRRKRIPPAPNLEHEADPTADVHEHVERSDKGLALERAVQLLPAERRLILSLTVLGEMTSEEIGVQLGKPAGTVRYELNQARQFLSKKMREWTEAL